MDAAQDVYHFLRQAILGGDSVQQATRRMAAMVGPELAKTAAERYLAEVEQVRKLKDPLGLTGDDNQGWYPGPQPEDLYCQNSKSICSRSRNGMRGL